MVLWPRPHPWWCPTLGCGLRVPLREGLSHVPTYPQFVLGGCGVPTGQGLLPCVFWGPLCGFGGCCAWEQFQNCRTGWKGPQGSSSPDPTEGGGLRVGLSPAPELIHGGRLSPCPSPSPWGCPRVLGLLVLFSRRGQGRGPCGCPPGGELHPRGPVCVHLRAGVPCVAPRSAVHAEPPGSAPILVCEHLCW